MTAKFDKPLSFSFLRMNAPSLVLNAVGHILCILLLLCAKPKLPCLPFPGTLKTAFSRSPLNAEERQEWNRADRSMDMIASTLHAFPYSRPPTHSTTLLPCHDKNSKTENSSLSRFPDLFCCERFSLMGVHRDHYSTLFAFGPLIFLGIPKSQTTHHLVKLLTHELHRQPLISEVS